MTVAVAFDTLEYARRLQDAGIAAPQAEAQARALADALRGRVASPSDLDALEARLVSRIDALDNRVNGRVDGLVGRIDAVESGLNARFDALESGLNGRIDSLDSRLSGRMDGMEGRIDGRIDKLAGSVDTLKWLVGLLTAFNIATFARVMLH